MAELTPQERLQPSLLDRLTDDEPGTRDESRNKRILSIRQLRECVLRDLSWLLNTTQLEANEDLDAYPEVRRSTVNYGVPSLAGKN
jgi:type VI secretion system protein ImpF